MAFDKDAGWAIIIGAQNQPLPLLTILLTQYDTTYSH